ncbi:MAG: SIS domain-containing protein [Clostridia bacterium]|nr:SIS domain-containing protein [Clostridia bacterium]
MDIAKRYNELYAQVIKEHQQAFEAQGVEDIEKLMAAIVAAKRVFVLGAGREGIAARSFAMRLTHMGKEVHWVWDDTTPGMGAGDLLILNSGSGRIGHIHYIAERGKATGATLAVITGTPLEITPALADVVLFIPAHVYLGTDPRCVPSLQPMGNLYEQHCFMLFDIIIMLLEEQLQLDHDKLESRHRNVE